MVRDNASEAVTNVIRVMGSGARLFFLLTFVFACAGLAVNAVYRTRSLHTLILDTAQAAIAILVFQMGFMIFKTTMPFLVPFYADPAFVKADAILHLGNDPWKLTHNWASMFPIEWLASLYLKGWLLPAILLPIVFAALDSDAKRVRRMLILYFVAWIFVGNVLALVGMSVGPIYFDRLYGGESFADLPTSFHPISQEMQVIRSTQEGLWIAYTHMAQARGSGISAFPSVHLSVATLTAIYVYERSRYLLPVAVVGVAAILFMSVYTGYHYAVDGYVSILIVIGFWLYLRHHDRKSIQ
ncbi:phosphatase PAP2 family protein [Aliiroseovarius sp. 2305UL8-7]|uniref:phosphatase PAP2 family protein n=1 Tax=Aliiroseovarius conchicola TaxID=3121637 RepID=UPI003529149B